MNKTGQAWFVALLLALAVGCGVGVVTGNIKLPTSDIGQEQEFEFPDCDADDKIGTWDVKDCGPSPAARKTTVPVSKKPTTR